jgi:hypothetical protein
LLYQNHCQCHAKLRPAADSKRHWPHPNRITNKLRVLTNPLFITRTRVMYRSRCTPEASTCYSRTKRRHLHAKPSPAIPAWSELRAE